MVKFDFSGEKNFNTDMMKNILMGFDFPTVCQMDCVVYIFTFYTHVLKVLLRLLEAVE